MCMVKFVVICILVTLLLVNVHRRNMWFDLRGLFCHVLYVIVAERAKRV